ncbi:ankyrin repeat domain-containing protein 50 [Pseudoscourfieldia marina]
MSFNASSKSFSFSSLEKATEGVSFSAKHTVILGGSLRGARDAKDKLWPTGDATRWSNSPTSSSPLADMLKRVEEKVAMEAEEEKRRKMAQEQPPPLVEDEDELKKMKLQHQKMLQSRRMSAPELNQLVRWSCSDEYKKLDKEVSNLRQRRLAAQIKIASAINSWIKKKLPDIRKQRAVEQAAKEEERKVAEEMKARIRAQINAARELEHLKNQGRVELGVTLDQLDPVLAGGNPLLGGNNNDSNSPTADFVSKYRRRRHSTTNELVKGVPQLPRLSSESRSSEFSTYSSFDHDNDDDDNKIGDGDNDGDMTLEPEFSSSVTDASATQPSSARVDVDHFRSRKRGNHQRNECESKVHGSSSALDELLARDGCGKAFGQPDVHVQTTDISEHAMEMNICASNNNESGNNTIIDSPKSECCRLPLPTPNSTKTIKFDSKTTVPRLLEKRTSKPSTVPSLPQIATTKNSAAATNLSAGGSLSARELSHDLSRHLSRELSVNKVPDTSPRPRASSDGNIGAIDFSVVGKIGSTSARTISDSTPLLAEPCQRLPTATFPELVDESSTAELRMRKESARRQRKDGVAWRQQKICLLKPVEVKRAELLFEERQEPPTYSLRVTPDMLTQRLKNAMQPGRHVHSATPPLTEEHARKLFDKCMARMHVGVGVNPRHAKAWLNKDVGYGLRLVHIAAQFGWVDALATLRDRGADFMKRDDERKTPLWHAAEAPCTLTTTRAAVSVLLAATRAKLPNGVWDYDSVAIKLGGGMTLVHACASAGVVDELSAILSAAGNDKRLKTLLSKLDEDGRSPLILAAQRGHAEAATLLMQAGAAVSANELRWACLNGHAEVARVMVSFGADAQERDEDGLSCAEYARADGWHALADEMEKIVDARVHQGVTVVAVA